MATACTGDFDEGIDDWDELLEHHQEAYQRHVPGVPFEQSSIFDSSVEEGEIRDLWGSIFVK